MSCSGLSGNIFFLELINREQRVENREQYSSYFSKILYSLLFTTHCSLFSFCLVAVEEDEVEEAAEVLLGVVEFYDFFAVVVFADGGDGGFVGGHFFGS